MKPLCVDLFCGLGGWTEGFLAEGYECIGYDIEAHDYGTGGYPGKLILRDVRSIHGSEFKDAAVIVASPPCQAYSYRAMPWKRAKALPPPDNTLFNECFRIQREASAAAGHHIPMVVENVRGAQPWVGRAKANYGSFYLWGDVGMVGNRVVAFVGGKILGNGISPTKCRKGAGHSLNKGDAIWRPANVLGFERPEPNLQDAEKVPGFRFDGGGGSFQSAAVKTTGRSLSKGALKWGPHNMGPGEQMMAEIAANQRESDGVKEGGDWWNAECRKTGMARFGSKSNSRKAASAMIAKIPLCLALYIARVFNPAQDGVSQ
jgi:hypothetical protein